MPPFYRETNLSGTEVYTLFFICYLFHADLTFICTYLPNLIDIYCYICEKKPITKKLQRDDFLMYLIVVLGVWKLALTPS